MKLTGSQIIGFSFSNKGQYTFNGINPQTGEILSPNYHEATSDEVDKAINMANKAFGIYKKKSAADKAAFLDKIADNSVKYKQI